MGGGERTVEKGMFDQVSSNGWRAVGGSRHLGSRDYEQDGPDVMKLLRNRYDCAM